MKMTMREKDYAVIGELARRLEDPRGVVVFLVAGQLRLVGVSTASSRPK
jgi:hypothetical protein